MEVVADDDISDPHVAPQEHVLIRRGRRIGVEVVDRSGEQRRRCAVEPPVEEPSPDDELLADVAHAHAARDGRSGVGAVDGGNGLEEDLLEAGLVRRGERAHPRIPAGDRCDVAIDLAHHQERLAHPGRVRFVLERRRDRDADGRRLLLGYDLGPEVELLVRAGAVRRQPHDNRSPPGLAVHELVEFDDVGFAALTDRGALDRPNRHGGAVPLRPPPAQGVGDGIGAPTTDGGHGQRSVRV